MITSPIPAFALAAIFAVSTVALAEEKNGLIVTVTKKGAAKAVGRPGYSEWGGRSVALAVAVKNNSIRSLPEGVISWTVVVRRLYGLPVMHTGTQKLTPLRPVQSTEIQLGPVDIGYSSSYAAASGETEKIDHEVVISHDGKETIRVASSSNFASLAARAVSNDSDGNFGEGGPERRRRIGDPKPVAEAPKFIEPEKVPPAGGVPVVTPKPPPYTPPPVETTPRRADTPPAAPAAFDFFNLGGKNPPPPK